MSDEVVTSVADALPPSGDTGQAVTSIEAPSTSASGDVAVKQPSTQEKPAKVNLNDLPEYRNLKSEWDRREAQYRNELARLSEAQEASKLAGMNEGQRDKYLLEKYKTAAEQATQEAQNLLMEQQRAKDIADLSAEYGVPSELLEHAGNYTGAKEIARKYAADVKAAARNYEEKVQRNTPDTGGVVNAKSANQKDIRIQQAIEAADPIAILGAMRGAD